MPAALDSDDFSQRQPPSNVDTPVDIRGVCIPAGNEILSAKSVDMSVGAAQQTVFPRRNTRTLNFLGCRLLFNEDFDCSPYEGFRNVHRHFMLRGHGGVPALLLDRVRKLPFHAAR